MSSLLVTSIILSSIFGGALLGMLIRRALPNHHLNPEAKDVVKLGTGLTGTMAALVLGLLVSSTKSAYDAQKSEVAQLSANLVLLDRILMHYGPAAQESRELLARWGTAWLELTWSTGQREKAPPPSAAGDALYDSIRQLAPASEAQQAARSQAQAVCLDLARTRVLLFAQQDTSLSTPMLVILVFWLSAIFASFGMLAPPNPTTVVTLLICALSVSGALFLILEMDQPFSGLVQISSAPLQEALAQIGH